MKLAATCLVTCLVATSAYADDGGPRSDGTATAISLGAGLGLPIALAATAGGIHDRAAQDTLMVAAFGALALGPTAGHWYAGRTWTNATTARIVGGVAVAGGIAMAFSACPLFSSSDDCHGSPGGALALIGGGTVVVSYIYDMATAGRSAREYNATHMTITPAPVSTGGAPGLGLALAGAF